MSVAQGVSTVTKKVPVAKPKKNWFATIALGLFVIGTIVVFLGTFIYFVNRTNQYKAATACSGVNPKPSVAGIVMWVIGALLIVAAIAVIIFYAVKRGSPAGIAASQAQKVATSV